MADPVSPVGARNPATAVSAAGAINPEPVELDATPASTTEEVRLRRGSREDGGAEEREKREQRIQERKGDAAVVAEVPRTPGAEEFEKSVDAEGRVGGEREGGGTA